MSIFSYTARSADGVLVAGSLAADGRDQALARLRTRTLFVTSLQNEQSPGGLLVSTCAAFPVRESSKVAFFRSFATLIGSGVPIRRALLVGVESCRDARLTEALRSILSDVESGSPLSGAMARRPKEFAPLYIAMIKAGEIGGALHDVLERLAEFMERDRMIRKRVMSALTYPAIVGCTAVGLVLFLLANTIPAFSAMFDEMHVALPASTRVLIAIGEFLKTPFSVALLAALALLPWLLMKYADRLPAFRFALDTAKLNVPIFGAILRKATIARFARTLGTLLRCGVALVSALDAAQGVVENAVYRRCARSLVEALRDGDPLTASLERSGLFEPLFLQLLHVGEETGALDSMLLRLADYYEFDVETAIATLGSALEPLLIISLGVVVGTIVASVLIPLYSVIGSIK